ncbi:hypothetical protein [Haloarcula amylovorans]|uniref:hypothetical protein n=1 Tax=Haloarcula amylovorans TaxID=2562280 RepID=UPI001075E8AE|nr:hypothetical protein [Halomicroarcula amylolytica]
MSVTDRLLAGETVELADLRTATWRAVLGDRTGATLLLASFVWVGLTWRLGFFSNDQYTFANTLVAVVEGHLDITRAVYGPASGATPGTYLVDGRVYGRNYGVVLVSAVWYVALRALAAVADVRVVLSGAWSLALVGVAHAVGTRLDRQRTAVVAGTAVGLALFCVNLALTTPLSSWWLPLVALQLTTALAAALLTVVCYRLVSRLHGRRLGVAAALATMLASPVGFWATLPKRHSVTALLVVCAMYTLYRSRAAPTHQRATRFRALTYVWVGAMAWVHAPEGFILLVAVAAVDVPTARSNAPRDLLLVGAALLLSLLPFFLTNATISGNPLSPPRLLDSYTGDVLSGGNAGSAASGDAGGTTGRGGDSLLPTPVSRIVGQFVASYALLLDPGHLSGVFVHTGYVPTLRSAQDAAINLSVLASMPLLGALVAVPLLAIRRAQAGGDRFVIDPRNWSPVRTLDAFSLVYVGLLVGLYLQQVLIHHMFTVRYLHPLYPIAVYWLARTPEIRRTVAGDPRPLSLSYAGTIGVGVPAYLGVITTEELVLGEAVQLYALVALPLAAVVAAWALLETVSGGFERVGVVALGLAAGATTVYLLVAGLSLFPTTGEFLLPLSRVVSEQVHYARLLGSSPPV